MFAVYRENGAETVYGGWNFILVPKCFEHIMLYQERRNVNFNRLIIFFYKVKKKIVSLF